MLKCDEIKNPSPTSVEFLYTVEKRTSLDRIKTGCFPSLSSAEGSRAVFATGIGKVGFPGCAIGLVIE